MSIERCWTYEQATGDLLDETNTHRDTGYSGFGEWKNNPNAQSFKGVGPIPRGWYNIEAPHDDAQVGPFAMRLVPDASNEMFGRTDFLIHGDSKEHPGQASHGCIILDRATREQIAASGINRIQVTHG